MRVAISGDPTFSQTVDSAIWGRDINIVGKHFILLLEGPDLP
jgi:hypothetical protein